MFITSSVVCDGFLNLQTYMIDLYLRLLLGISGRSVLRKLVMGECGEKIDPIPECFKLWRLFQYRGAWFVCGDTMKLMHLCAGQG